MHTLYPLDGLVRVLAERGPRFDSIECARVPYA